MKHLATGFACLVFALVACGGDRTPANDGNFVEQHLSLMEAIAGSITAADGDCGKLASNLDALVPRVQRHMKVFEKAWNESKSGDVSKLDKQLDDAHMEARMEKMMPAFERAMACEDDPRVRAVMEKVKLPALTL
jgi:hypothetical protein